MIVPGFIVGRIYRKGSLHREPGGYYAFSFRNTIARGTATLVSPERIAVKSSVGDIELTRCPERYVDGRLVNKDDAMMLIGGQEIPHYDEEAARQKVGESITFNKGDDFITRIRGELPDGRHEFRSVFHSRQFGEIILNFSDYLGEAPRRPLGERLLDFGRALLGRAGPAHETPAAPADLKETRFFILKDQRPDPDFGRLLDAVNRKEPDRVPLIELMVDEEVKTAFLERPLTSMRDEVEFWLATGYDYVPLFVLNVTPRNIRVIDSHETTYKEGLQERAWIDESRGIIRTEEDLEACEWPEADDSLFESFEELEKELPAEMKVIGCISAVFETVTQAMGLETFCMNLYDRPDLIRALFDKAGTLITRCIERILEFESTGAVWITDDLAYRQGPIISPEMLRTHVFPWYRKFVEMVHARGLPVLLHTCGNTEDLFEDIIEAGFDALHPLEANAVDIYRAKEEIGRSICLCGNLDLSYMLTRAEPAEIEEDVRKHLRGLAPGGGYCLGSSNSIPNYVPLEKYLAMNRACLELGRYPISV